MMQTFLLILQVIIALFLVAVILVQVKGTGFGRAWGGQQSSFSRRGLEALVFKLTFALAGLFIIISILLIVL